MKRYLLFIGKCYYPNGGMDDFVGDFDTIEECEKVYNCKMREGFNKHWKTLEKYLNWRTRDHWMHVYDIENKTEVLCK